jgi:hypothetical protein
MLNFSSFVFSFLSLSHSLTHSSNRMEARDEDGGEEKEEVS